MKSTLSKRLKKARKTNYLSLDEVAELMGISKNDIKDIERGKRKVTNSELSAFAKIYGVKVKDLVDDSTDERDIEFTRCLRL